VEKMGVEDFLHVGITVTDLEKSIWFYTHVMGMEIEARAEVEGEKISRVVHVEDAEIDICLVKKNNMRIELLDCQNTPPGNNSVPRNRRQKQCEIQKPLLPHVN
jgi:catechol 2,3-dioxygenase-like lactoylglutathione lyase family enzyme